MANDLRAVAMDWFIKKPNFREEVAYIVYLLKKFDSKVEMGKRAEVSKGLCLFSWKRDRPYIRERTN